MNRLVALFACLCLTLAQSFAGNDVGHGGDYITIEDNPWFIGADPVKYCLVLSRDFSAPASAAIAAVENALSDWKATLQRLRPPPTESFLLDGAPQTISVDFVRGECSADVDLIFYLGIINGEIADDLAHRPSYSVAFAKQTSFNQVNGRAKGFVWLTPDQGEGRYLGPKSQDSGFWTHSPTLHNVLLHEIGHVMGFQHQEGIMSASLPADAVATASDILYSSQIYVSQRWTRVAERAGRSVCGSILASSNGMISRLVGQADATSGWVACLQWDRALANTLSLTLIPQQGGRKHTLSVHELTEYSTPSLKEVIGCYRRNDKPQDSFPACHRFVEPDSDVLLTTMEANGEKYSVVISTEETQVRLNFIDANQNVAGWFGIYLNQAFPAPVL